MTYPPNVITELEDKIRLMNKYKLLYDYFQHAVRGYHVIGLAMGYSHVGDFETCTSETCVTMRKALEDTRI